MTETNQTQVFVIVIKSYWKHTLGSVVPLPQQEQEGLSYHDYDQISWFYCS